MSFLMVSNRKKLLKSCNYFGGAALILLEVPDCKSNGSTDGRSAGL